MVGGDDLMVFDTLNGPGAARPFIAAIRNTIGKPAVRPRGLHPQPWRPRQRRPIFYAGRDRGPSVLPRAGPSDGGRDDARRSARPGLRSHPPDLGGERTQGAVRPECDGDRQNDLLLPGDRGGAHPSGGRATRGATCWSICPSTRSCLSATLPCSMSRRLRTMAT